MDMNKGRKTENQPQMNADRLVFCWNFFQMPSTIGFYVLSDPNRRGVGFRIAVLSLVDAAEGCSIDVRIDATPANGHGASRLSERGS